MNFEDKQEALLRTFGVVHAFDQDEGFFVISPDRLGFGVITPPIPGVDAAMIDSLNAFLNLHFPPHTVVQFCLYLSPDLEDVLYRFQQMRSHQQDPLLRELGNKRVEYLRELTDKPIGQVADARLRQLRLIITIQVKQSNGIPTPDQREKLQELRKTVHASLKGIGFRFEALTQNSYLRFMETLLNHGPSALWRGTPWTKAEAGELLCNQILDPDTCIDVKSDRLNLGDYADVRVVSVKRYPDYTYPGMASRYIGDIMKGTAALRDPMLITVNIIYPDHENKRGKIEADWQWTKRNAEGKLARFIPDFGRRAKSLDIMMESINAGNRICYAYIGAAVFSKNGDAAIQSSTEVQGMFRTLGFQAMPDKYAVHGLFSQLIPFGAEEEMQRFLSRYRTLTTRDVVPMLPVIGSWRGTGTPLLTLIARDGQLMPFSPYDSDGNYNMVIAAQSGAGKSYLANNIVTNFLTVGGRAWIIDKGYSYKKLCRVMEGQYIEFDDKSDLCINPFPLVKKFDEEVDILANIISVMAAPKEGLDDFQSAAVIRILTEQYALHKQALVIDHLEQAFLAETDPRIRDIGHQLYSFTSKGQFGRYFNGPNNVDMNNRLVVLELQQLSGRQHLQRVVLLQLIYQIQQGMDATARDLPKMVLIDEVWNLLAAGDTSDFIIGTYRQIRKFGGSAAVCTQSIHDFYLNKGSEAIMENSAHMLLLSQKPESITQAQQQGRLQLTEGEFRLLGSVHTVPGEYSEIMVRNALGTGVGRLVESPFNNLLYSSKASDVTAIEAYLKQGHSQVDAINLVLRDRSVGTASAPAKEAA